MNSTSINPLMARNRIHPHMFALYVSFASILMMFGALTSAYIVRHAAGDWLEFNLPTYFYYSTAALLLSSAALHYSYRSFIGNNERGYKIFLPIALVLGFIFVTLQYHGWNTLFNMGVDLKLNVSGSFLYLITGLHALHILGGLACIIVAIINAFTLPFQPTVKRQVRFRLVLHYWHFVDILWIYLLAFLLIVK